MKTYFLLTYSQLFGFDMASSITEFANNTNLSTEDIITIVKNEGGEPPTNDNEPKGLIADYKRGNIDTNKFVLEMTRVLQQKSGILLPQEDFIAYWNIGADIQDSKVENLKKLAELESPVVIAISCTNELHDKHIREQLKLKEIDYNRVVSKSFLSYEEKTLNRKELEKIAASLYKETIDICDLQGKKDFIDKIGECIGFDNT